MFDVAALLSVSVPPDSDLDKWLESAMDGVRYVQRNAKSSDIVLFTNVGRSYIFSVLAPVAQVAPLDAYDLERAYLNPTRQWMLEHVSGGGQPDRMYLASPMDHQGCNSTAGGEQLVFSRFFSGVDDGQSRIELSQCLVQALDLYWLEEHHAYCRLDLDGDIEPVIRVNRLGGKTGHANDVVVTINALDLHRYMAVTEMALVMKFDFTRVQDGAFGGWHDGVKRTDHHDDTLVFHGGAQPRCSFVNGSLVVHPETSKSALIDKSNIERRGIGRQYASFIARDWKNKCVADISCSPDALASYFEKDSPLPFQVTPAFFNAGVLQKYKADPEKYTLHHRSIRSRGGWELKTYDVNEAGQVHTYLCYLADLPYKEQMYWRSFNEEPKAGISERAFTTDFKGHFDKLPDAIVDLKRAIAELDERKPDWWQPRGEAAAGVVHYPHTPSPEEWANAILNLDQFVIEGFATSALRAHIKDEKGNFDKSWGSVRLLQQCYVCAGLDEAGAAAAVAPLRTLHNLRSKLKGHLAEKEKQALIKESRKEHGSLSHHFQNLADDVFASFQRITALLG